MKRDAEVHAGDDKIKREFAEAKNEGENKVFQIEKLLKESGDKIGEADRAVVVKAVDKVKDALIGTDPNAIKTAVSELETAAQAMAQHLNSQGAGPTSATPSGAEKKNDDVIDAEYEVKK